MNILEDEVVDDFSNSCLGIICSVRQCLMSGVISFRAKLMLSTVLVPRLCVMMTVGER